MIDATSTHKQVLPTLVACCVLILLGPLANAQSAASLYRDAEKQYGEKSYGKAAALYEQLAKEYSGDRRADEAAFKAGLSHYKLGDPDIAIAHLEPYVETHKASIWAAKARRILVLAYNNTWHEHRAAERSTMLLREAAAYLEDNLDEDGALDELVLTLFQLSDQVDQLPYAEDEDYETRIDARIDIMKQIVALNAGDSVSAKTTLAIGHFLYYNKPDSQAKGLDTWRSVIRKWPRTDSAPGAQFRIAEHFENSEEFPKALGEYRVITKRWPKSDEADNAKHAIRHIAGPAVSIELNETSLPGEPIPAAITTRNVKQIKFAAYKVDFVKPFLALQEPDMDKLVPATPTKEWTVDIKDWRAHKWHRDTIDLPIEKPGVYMIKARDRDSKEESAGGTIVSSLVLVQTADRNGEILTWVVRRSDGLALKGVQLDLRYFDWGDDKRHKLGDAKTDADGLARITVPTVADDSRVETLARYGDEIAMLADTYIDIDRDEIKELVGYIYTERPVYRPGQTVNYSAVLRTYEDGKLTNLPDKRAEVTIYDPRGEKVTDERLSTNEFGSLHGELALDEEPPLGMYSVHVEIGDDSTSGQFRVEEYKKPEFKVSVEPGGEDYKPGQSATAEVSAEYYFGGPVPGATVSYSVTRQHYWNRWRFPGPWDWYMADHRDWGEPSWYGGGDVITEGEGVLDLDGKLTVEFETADDETDYQYSVSAEVTDQSRRTISGSTTIKVTQNSFTLHPNTGQHLYHADDKVTVDVKAVTPNDQPVRTSGELMVYRVVPATREVGEGDDKHEEDYEDLQPIFGEAMAFNTDAEGLAHITFVPDRDGKFEAKVTAADPKREKGVEATTRFWAVNDDFAGQNLDTTNLELVTERDVYEKGETARVLVSAPVADRDALIVLTARDLQKPRIERLNGQAKVLEIEITDAHVPEFNIQVWIVGESRFFSQEKHIFVPPSDKFLQVAVATDKDVYRPGETGQFEVTALDNEGNPVDAEVALAVTDDSVYYIQEELVDPIHKVFYARNMGRNYTRWWCSWRGERVHGGSDRMAKMMAPGMMGAGADEELGVAMEAPAPDSAPMLGVAFMDGNALIVRDAGGEMAAPTLRASFADTCFWGPTLRTGDDGKASAEVTFPDNLTTWRATSRALTATSKFGQTKAEVRTKKNVIARLQTPRFLVQSDRATISTIAHNYLETAKDMRVELEVEGLELIGDATATVRVEPGGEKRVDREVTATTAGTALITTKALTDVESDAMQLPVPVLVHGVEKFVWRAGQVAGEAGESFTLPAERIVESDTLSVQITPSVAATLLDALPYLADYPYGCVEQTMSRFLPSVIVAEVAKKLDLDTGEKLSDVPRKVKRGLRRLYSQQNGDGSWGWWSGGTGNLYMTAYVTSGLLRAKAAEYDVRQDVIDPAIEWMVESVGKEKRLDTVAYVAYVLAQSGRKPKQTIARVYDKREELNEHTRALLALAMQHAGDGRAKTVVSNLEDYRVETENGCHWGEESWGWRWSDDQIEATAASLLAMLRVDPDNPLIPKTVWWLVTNRRGDHWKSTKDTALALAALSEYVVLTGELKADYTAKVFVNDKLIRAIEVTPENALELDGAVNVPRENLKTGDNTVRIEREGEGALYYSLLGTHFTTEAFITGAKSVIGVDRKYYTVEEYVDEDKKLQTRRKPVTGPVASGTKVEVELTLTSENEFDYVMFEDFKPAGCEPVDLHSGHTWGDGVSAYREFRDEKVVLFIDHLPQGTHKLTYQVRAEIPGDFHALPNIGQGMYMPDVRCLSDEFVMTIR